MKVARLIILMSLHEDILKENYNSNFIWQEAKKQLKPRTFKWKGEKVDRTEIVLDVMVLQKVKDVLPNLIDGEE